MNRSEWTAGDANVARLLGQPYDPPSVPADFAQRVQARMLEVAADMARQRAAAPRRMRYRQRWSALAGMAAMLGIVALGLRWVPSPVSPSRPRPSVAPTASLVPGARIATGNGERRRVALSDGSVLSLNENTQIHHDAPRHLLLKSGEIFVEVAPQPAGKAAPLFTVATPHRHVQAAGTKFLVRADAEGTGVAVTQGQVHVSDWDDLLSAGQQLAANANTVTPTPRFSYLLDWTRDLVVAAASPLVPPNSHAGGALVAVDPQGHAGNLSLRKYHIDVHIEDGFARTTIDQTYFNHTLGRLEGTFFFPLPADASLSRLAMYVDGQLMEGGMVERDYGRMVFDQIVTKMKDPALLEWVDGHTFKMRVFPLEPRQEKRIILSYTQRLPNLYGRLSYRFPGGHSLGTVRDWSFHARIKDGKDMAWHCASHKLTPSIRDQNDLLLDASGRQEALGRDLALDLMDASEGEAVRFATQTQDGYRYLMLRYRPDLPGTAKRQRRDWVFLFESSAERNPLLARAQVEIVRTLLANAERDDTFAVLTAGSQVHAFSPSPVAATPDNIAGALTFLEKSHLLGALDLDAGLKAAAKLLNHSENPILVHLGCGRAVLGERRADALAARIPRQACYAGVGVGKHGASDFMRRAAQRCQGYVTEINPDEAVVWRAFDLFAVLNSPRCSAVRVEDPKGKTHFLCPTSLVAQGEELCAIARLRADAPLPQSVCVTGSLAGQPFAVELPVQSPRSEAAYLPRTWARLEINRLLAEDAVKNKSTIIALSKAMYVMTPYTSLLVLENEAMYAQYKVDRGRKDHWAMYPCPAKIAVVHEPPSPNEPAGWLVRFDPVTGEPLPVLSDGIGLNQENNQLGFFPPAEALTVKGSSTIHTRPSKLIINPPQSGGSDGPYKIQLEAPSIYTASISVESDAQLRARIRRENRERTSELTQLLANPDQGYLIALADLFQWEERAAWSERMSRPDRQYVTVSQAEEWERQHREIIRQQALERELSRARTNPPLPDIWSAHSLNVLLLYLIAQDKQGVVGPHVPLSEDILAHLNLTIGGGGNINLLKDKCRLKWPATLQREMFKDARERLSLVMQTAYESVRSGKALEDAAGNDLRTNCKKLRDTLDANVDQFTPSEYIEGRRYLQYVRSTIEALLSPDVADFVNGTWRAKVGSVTELVRILGKMHVRFAPATEKDEAAYVALYHALAAYDAGLSPTNAPAAGAADPEEAERLLTGLLSDPAKAKRPALWRRAARVAEQRKQFDSAVQRLRRALELEKDRPRDLPSLRGDWAWFLSLAQQRVQELAAQHCSPPRELLEEIMTVADQWRGVDPLDGIPCDLAARILSLAGERESAWGYLTSPARLQRGTAGAWLELALRQQGKEEHDLAERAYAAATSLEPSNGEIVWKRALNHRAAGRHDAAEALLKQLDKGVWPEPYRSFQLRARRALEENRK